MNKASCIYFTIYIYIFTKEPRVPREGEGGANISPVQKKKRCADLQNGMGTSIEEIKKPPRIGGAVPFLEYLPTLHFLGKGSRGHLDRFQVQSGSLRLLGCLVLALENCSR